METSVCVCGMIYIDTKSNLRMKDSSVQLYVCIDKQESYSLSNTYLNRVIYRMNMIIMLL